MFYDRLISDFDREDFFQLVSTISFFVSKRNPINLKIFPYLLSHICSFSFLGQKVRSVFL